MATSQSEEAFLLPKRKLYPQADKTANILENCLRGTEIALSLSGILQVYRNSTDVDEELSSFLRRHQVLEEKLSETLEQTPSGKRAKQAKEERGREVVQLEESFKNSVRDLVRYFRLHPDVYLSLKVKMGVGLGESETKCFRMLKRAFSSIIETLPSVALVIESPLPSSSAERLKELEAQEEDMAATLKELCVKILKKESEIEGLEKTLKMSDEPEARNSGLPTEMTSSTNMEEEVEKQQASLMNMMLEHSDVESKMLLENEVVQEDAQRMVDIFDDYMETMQGKLEKTEEEYQKIEKELKDMEEPVSILKEKCNQILERRQQMVKTKAATTIQTWWRANRAEKALEDEDRSKGQTKDQNKKVKKGKKVKKSK